jgi:hypothetical protein
VIAEFQGVTIDRQDFRDVAFAGAERFDAGVLPAEYDAALVERDEAALGDRPGGAIP